MNTKIKLWLSCILVLVSLATLSLHAQLNVTYQGDLPYTQSINDIWGYVDASGNEYALVGTQTGTSIVDISTPSTPTEIHFIPGTGSTWRDLKTWGTRAYVTTEATDQLLIVDLSGLPATINSSITNLSIGFSSAHNIFIDENGVGYLFGSNLGAGGAVMIDIAGNPTNPTHLGNYSTYYIHDGFARNDVLWGSHIYAGHFGAIDVSNKSAPAVMATQTTDKVFTHACWLSTDNQTLFTVDERSDAPVEAWDVSNLANIQRRDTYKAHAGTSVTPHNVFVRGDFVILSYYTAGVVILDATYPYNLIQVGNYDTSPATGSGFSGCWGTYPFFASGTLLATDRQEGLFVLTPNYTKACYLEGIVIDASSTIPITGATVTLSDALAMVETTNIFGSYATGTVTPGTYTLQIAAPGYVTQTINVTFSGGCNGGPISTQNIALAPVPAPCSSGPTGSTVSTVTNNQATVSWNSDPNAIGYTVQYRLLGTATWTTINAATNTATITGLNPSSTYEFEIQIDCGSGTTSIFASNNTFTTLEQCDPPNSLNLTANTFNSLTVSWFMAANATNIVLEYTEMGVSSWQTLPATSSPAIITNLRPCTDYLIRIQSNCNVSGQTSTYSATQTYTTATPVATLTNAFWQECLGPIDVNTNMLLGDAGGTWSGGSYISAAGIFNPTGLPPGFYPITYTIAGNNCNISDNSNIVVGGNPTANWTPTTLRNCDGNYDLSTLIAGTTGGTWSGSSAVSSAGIFNPTALAAGNYAVTYQVGFGVCSDAQTHNIVVSDCPTAQLKILLEGNYSSGGMMNNALHTAGLVPTTQTYNMLPWNYSGTEMATSLPSNTVDWVLVELRAPSTYALVDRVAALLLQNGDVVDVSGNPNLLFPNASTGTNYHIVVRHRNHLDVMSANTMSLPNTFDFTTAVGQSFGTQQQIDMGGGRHALYAGDHNSNGIISVDDYNDFVTQISQINIYKATDTNLDGTISVADFNVYRNNASVIGILQIRY